MYGSRSNVNTKQILCSVAEFLTFLTDGRQQTSLLFGQAPYGQMRSCASSSWDNPGGAFKFAETKAPWLKPAGAAGIDGLHLSSQQVWNNIMPHGAHQDFDGFMAFKGTSAKVPNQGSFSSIMKRYNINKKWSFT